LAEVTLDLVLADVHDRGSGKQALTDTSEEQAMVEVFRPWSDFDHRLGDVVMGVGLEPIRRRLGLVSKRGVAIYAEHPMSRCLHEESVYSLVEIIENTAPRYVRISVYFGLPPVGLLTITGLVGAIGVGIHSKPSICSGSTR
ncbi:MAG: hypothetical protein KC457_34390, partial [Myxococcales bacterium]|nr:hypothetical protein [Myxococcales bacterium]